MGNYGSGTDIIGLVSGFRLKPYSKVGDGVPWTNPCLLPMEPVTTQLTHINYVMKNGCSVLSVVVSLWNGYQYECKLLLLTTDYTYRRAKLIKLLIFIIFKYIMFELESCVQGFQVYGSSWNPQA